MNVAILPRDVSARRLLYYYHRQGAERSKVHNAQVYDGDHKAWFYLGQWRLDHTTQYQWRRYTRARQVSVTALPIALLR